MQPSDINGGRFYIRPLHDDDRIDDRPALAAVFGHEVDDDFVTRARHDWLSDTVYTWASCEQTCIDMAALITLVRHGDGTCTITGQPAGDPATLVPNPDDLERKTYQDAADEAVSVVTRWAEGVLGLTTAAAGDHGGTTA
ncbi:hypothetical protein ACFSSC_11150 [Corynebacterium mendelii]|uniref:Uncharacterized protein n=1 Tax=Corynebacterium mendelii TaxID=2765362 RepID=A0A939E136_9CORY|nr:hypothetical protein [Corynebacterium mendelii]MBN9644516.1 hypothetical protein [Corynebacterium mendelii]